MSGGGYLAGANAVFQGYAAYQNSRAQERSALRESSRFEAAAVADRYNAAVLYAKNQQINSATAQREDSARRSVRMVGGRNRATAAENGMGLGGSTADALRQSELLAELDVLNIRYEGNLQATDAANQARLSEFSAAQNDTQAQFMRDEARRIRRNAPFAVAGAALSGGAQGLSFMG